MKKLQPLRDKLKNDPDFKNKLYRSRFLLPNLVTVGNLFCGLLTIIYASSERFDKACIAVMIAILLDGLDGQVARRFNATSKFGVEFDSFSDLVSFGLAPGLLMYYWAFLPHADEFGVFVCFVYVISAASRLARFNITCENLNSFQGLPTPASAAMVVALVNFDIRSEYEILVLFLATIIMIGLGFLMVSSIPYFSLKRLKIMDTHIFVRIFLGAMIGFIWYKPTIVLTLIISFYCLSGPVSMLRKQKELKNEKEI